MYSLFKKKKKRDEYMIIELSDDGLRLAFQMLVLMREGYSNS